jgi:chromosome partitioning protein
MSNCKVISVMNWKGGVGKTTLTHHLGTGLHILTPDERAEYIGSKEIPRVLFVDNDAQCNLSISCLHADKYEDLIYNHKVKTLKELYQHYLRNEDPHMDIHEFILKDQVRMDGNRVYLGIDIIPAHQDLVYTDLDIAMNSRGDFQNGLVNKDIYKFQYLARMLEGVKAEYDYIFIDCPPNVGYTTLNAFYASDYCLIPTLLDHLSSYGISALIQKVEKMSENFVTVAPGYTGMKIIGIVANNVEERNQEPKMSQNMILERLQNEFGKLVFKPYLTHGDGITKTSEQGYPVYADRSSNAMKQKRLLLEILQEMLERI